MRLHSEAKGLSRLAVLPLWRAGSWSFVFIFAAISLFLVSAANPDSMRAVRMGTTDVFAPVLAAVNRPVHAAAEYVRAVSGIANLQAENTRLMEENEKLREWYQTAQLLGHENETLKKLLNIVPEEKGSYVTARVIADSGNAYVKSILVLAGSAQNVAKGQPAMAGDGLLGRVIESGEKASRILLVTDINSRIPVQVQGSDEKAIMGGNNTELPVLMHLPPDTLVTAGARVITSGHGGLFPYGLPVGEVVKNADGKFAVRPYAVSERVMFVRVLDKQDDPRLKEGKL